MTNNYENNYLTYKGYRWVKLTYAQEYVSRLTTAEKEIRKLKDKIKILECKDD